MRRPAKSDFDAHIPTADLLQALLKVVEENEFTRRERAKLNKKLRRAAKHGTLEKMSQVTPEWAWRICAALLSLNKYYWWGWETRSQAIWDLSNRPWQYPRWNERPCDLYLVAEQGIGDEILHSNAYGDLLARNPDTTVECDSRLIPAFERAFNPPHFDVAWRFESRWKDGVVGDPVPLGVSRGRHDAFMPCGNALKLYRKDKRDWPGPWLCLDADRLDDWRLRLAKYPRPHTGISWTGRVADNDVEPFLAGGGTHFNLNYTDGDDDRVVRLKTEDFDDLWHLIGALDRVFTTTNTTAHMAGSIGQHVHVLLPKPIYGELNNRLRWYYAQPHRYIYPSMRVHPCLSPSWGTAPLSSGQNWANISTVTGWSCGSKIRESSSERTVATG